MQKLSDKKIIDSWKKNVAPWVTAVREGEIESRLLVTNQAIVDAVIAQAPKTVLDIGCGEGWLVRELSAKGIQSLGIDVVPELIGAAVREGGGRFKTLSFEELSAERLKETFDMIVCNFSLLGNESVVHIFRQARALLNAGGSVVVQTIHPIAGCGDQEYRDGWREGSWLGFSEQFSDPAPWYFRTLETWENLFAENGFGLSVIDEPINPKTQTAASIVFTGKLVG